MESQIIMNQISYSYQNSHNIEATYMISRKKKKCWNLCCFEQNLNQLWADNLILVDISYWNMTLFIVMSNSHVKSGLQRLLIEEIILQKSSLEEISLKEETRTFLCKMVYLWNKFCAVL